MEQKTFEIGIQETDGDIQQNKKIAKKWCVESKKVWQIAGPAILNAISLFSLEFVTAAFAGRLGDLELAAVSEVHNVIAGFVYGVMLGMASALATLCGQAVGAGQFSMLGVYLQRSWIITGFTSLLLTPMFVFTSPILKLLRQDKDISHLAGKYAIWIIPQMFAYALNFPMQKFLQSQSKVWFMAITSMGGLAIHVLLNWVLVVKAGWGLFGAAIAGNVSWLLDIAQFVYIISGYFPEAWTGFSCLAFKSLTNFLKLSLASAIMVCLEFWYFTAVILMVGGFKNATTSVDAISICIGLQLWTLTIAYGFTSSTSVRVSNELGAGNPKAAKFSISVNVLISAVIGLVFSATILATKKEFPRLFTNEQHVIRETSKLGYILAAIMFLNGIQPVLLGVAVGAGWQLQVALISIGCYYGFGLPMGALLGYKFKFGVEGILSAMLAGSLLQTLSQVIIIARTSWHKQALQAEERVRTWGGEVENQSSPDIGKSLSIDS
ncbi:PREDICTED: protein DETOXIFICATION 33-like isoform X1 [Nicotiana attenuata]|uniref:Protein DETOXIFICATION n=2 Tax=Nicotiana attenuata TaxID=49451 RepID=A0A1J6ICG7_NICAT|nr:PREDICTED: protein DETOXIFICATION 33-like isoform X1 [Nicotiana attenuata]OIS98199.1 protein detoxification 33 [Nicotiana attenuata]